MVEKVVDKNRKDEHMFGRLFAKLAKNLLINLAIAVLAPIPVIGVVARVVAFVC